MSQSKKLKFLAFSVSERLFAVDIMGIKEILRDQVVTEIPDAPLLVAGIINLRGELLSVVDSRVALGMERASAPLDSRVIVAESCGKRFALMVDGVREVVTIDIEQIEPPPGAGMNSEGAVLGVFSIQSMETEEVVMLLRLGALAGMATGEEEG